jgi:membrane protein involved in colicin uptake
MAPHREDVNDASQSSSGYEDGIGRRVLAFDRETGGLLERLVARPELAVFEKLLTDRIAVVASLEDERFARPRDLERDADDRLVVISEYVTGRRLSDTIEAAAEHGIVAGLDAGLGLLLELLPAIARLHDAGLVHGSLAPGRIMTTAAGQIVLLDAIYGEPLERLQLTRKRLWAEFRLAFPPTAGLARFDKAADLGHASIVAATLIVGRPLQNSDYPEGISALRKEILEIASIRGSQSFAEAVDQFFASTLPVAGRRGTPSADEAAIDLRKLVRKELGINTCRAALLEFLQQVESADQERAAGEAQEQAQRQSLDAERVAQQRAEAARVEAERKARDEAERKAREDAKRKAHEEAERKAREEAERKAREEAERKAREEAERKAREEAERKAREEAERKAREEAERKAREEAERKAREEAERKAREEVERKAREEAERKAREEAERKAREEAERKAREEAERKAREEAERKAREEAERKAREEAERKAREEAERKAREDAERKAREDAERKAREAAERKAREAAERKAREDADRKAREEAERKERERIEQARVAAEEARQKAERLERERREAERHAEDARREAERLERERIAAAERELRRLEEERRERDRRDAEERARIEAERREREEAERREREDADRAAAAAFTWRSEPEPPQPAAPAKSWLVPPDRAASFDPPVAEPPAPAPRIPPPPAASPAKPYPIYVAPSDPPAWHSSSAETQAPAAEMFAPMASTPPASIPLAPPSPAWQPQSGTSIRLRNDTPERSAPARAEHRGEPYADEVSAADAYGGYAPATERKPIPWKLIAAGVVLIAATYAVANGYLSTPGTSPVVDTVRKVIPKAATASTTATAIAGNVGRLNITTQPPGAKVTVDGKGAGETPLTLDGVKPGRHTLVLSGPEGSWKKTIRVEAGQAMNIDVPLYSGFVAISIPFVVEVAENGKALGTSENQIILSPGRHDLRLTNKELNYSATQAVDVQSGEVARLELDPRGRANINAAPWAEVWIDGEKAGDTPLANVPIRLGVREIVFKNPQYPERKQTVTITAGTPASISVDFIK